MRIRSFAAVLSAAVLGVSGSALAADGGWTVVASHGGKGAILTAADFTTATDGWAVGTSGTSLQGSGVDTLTEHWDGGAWRRVPSFAPSNSDEALTGVTSTDADNAWAVGWHDPYGTTRIHGLMLHWNGHAWSVVQDADHSPIATGIDARTASDVWAVGSDFFEHFDGSTWTTFPSPRVGAHPRAVVVLAADDAWAVGGRTDTRPGYHHDVPYLAHWDGTSWSTVRSPLRLISGSFESVSAVSPSDIWAVGSIGTGGTLPSPIAIHYDGTNWQRVALHAPDSARELAGVVAVSTDDVWAVGNKDGQLPNGFAVARTFTEHWDGTRWSTVASPNDSDHDNYLIATAAAGGTVWAFGTDGGTLIERR